MRPELHTDSLVAAAWGVITAAAGMVGADFTTIFFGVPAPVIVSASVGALAGFAYGDPIEPRKKLYLTAFANTVLAASFAAIVPDYWGWDWWESRHAAPLALILAFAARWVVPPAIEAVGHVIRNFNPFRKKENKP